MIEAVKTRYSEISKSVTVVLTAAAVILVCISLFYIKQINILKKNVAFNVAQLDRYKQDKSIHKIVFEDLARIAITNVTINNLVTSSGGTIRYNPASPAGPAITFER